MNVEVSIMTSLFYIYVISYFGCVTFMSAKHMNNNSGDIFCI